MILTLTRYLYDYLLHNATAREDYLKKFIVAGVFYPIAASVGVTSLTTLDGTVLTIKYWNADSLEISYQGNNPLLVPASPRLDGLVYDLDSELVPFEIPPEPLPEPTPDPPPVPQGVLPPQPLSAGLLTFNLVLLLLGYLFVIIC